MKKNFLVLSLLVLFLNSTLFAQNNNTVDITDEVYTVLNAAELKGLCTKLDVNKPYTESYILSKLNEILDNLELENDYVSSNEREIFLSYKDKFSKEVSNKFEWNKMEYSTSNDKDNFPITFYVHNYDDGFISSGLYTDKEQNQTGYEYYHTLDFFGNITDYISYRALGFLDLTKVPLLKLGDNYYIGNWWYSTHDQENKIVQDKTNSDYESKKLWMKDPRTINTYRLNSMLPYSYKKHWDGSVYHFGSINANGLTSWPDVTSFGFGMYGELHSSLFNNRLELGLGRYNREWASVDNGTSLSLNGYSHPYFGFDMSVKLFDWLSYSMTTGSLEFPNQRHINYNAWKLYDDEWGESDDGNKYVKYASPDIIDSHFFQSLFTLKMISADFKYLHIDFGSTCIYPKRVELGYMLPLIDLVIYQNSVGDYDNLGLFGNLQIKLPKIGYMWASLYMDEMNSLKARFWENTRCTFAYQGGIKSVFPWLPLGSVSLRYSKVEPYCYTHPAVRTPWYNTYVATSYSNNGENLGYYLQPNSDELLFRFDCKPVKNVSAGLQYQLIRHGTDWGTGAVEGSNIYSELVPKSADREAKRKYFLKDGTYEWMSVITLDGSVNLNSFNVPLKLNGSVGYIYDWFTGIEGEGGKNTKYKYINSNEYPERNGFVLSLGFTAFMN